MTLAVNELHKDAAQLFRAVAVTWPGFGLGEVQGWYCEPQI